MSSSREKAWERTEYQKVIGGKSFVLPFIKLTLLLSKGNMRQRFILQVLHMCVFVFTLPGGHFCKKKVRKVKSCKVK